MQTEPTQRRSAGERRGRRRGTTAIAAGAVAMLVGVAAAPGANADPSNYPPGGTKYPWAPADNEGDVPIFPDDPTSPIAGIVSAIPQQALDLFKACPDAAANGLDVPEQTFCIVINVTGGQLKLGGTEASIDPFSVVVAGGLASDGETKVVIGSGAGPTAVNIPGGILGVPALDPLLALDPLGVLTLSATPRLGEVVASNPVAFLTWAGGTVGDAGVLSVPLSIELHNTLLGETCSIPEFTLDLAPSAEGASRRSWYWDSVPLDPFDPPPSFFFTLREGGQLSDDGFAVPGADGCDGILGVGQALEDAGHALGLDGLANSLGMDDLNVIEHVVDTVAGLPADGGNHATLDIDIFSVGYNSFEGVGAGSYYELSGGTLGG